MKHHIKRLPFLLSVACFSFILLLSACRSGKNNKIQALVKSVSARSVPDGREGICNITARLEGRDRVILTGETTSREAAGELIDSLTAAGYDVSDSVKCLPDTLLNKAYLGLANLSVINLRKEPSHSSELVSQAVMGTPALILKQDDGWVFIQTPDKYLSWTESSSLTHITSEQLDSWKRADRVIYTGSSGWITQEPGKGEVIGDLVAGAILVRDGTQDGYTRVVLPDGRSGYVDSGLVNDFNTFSDPPAATAADILRRAAMYTGLPYLWGGSSSKAVDCSGFVQSVFFMNGLILSRDASLQARHGITIDISDGYGHLEPGDLLFFGSGGKVTHVAIYRGNSEFIHASSRVTINSFDSTRSDFSSYRKRTLISAKRILVSPVVKGLEPVARHKWYN